MNSSAFLYLLLCCVVLALVRGQEEDISEEPTAKIILYKHSETNPVVEGREFVVSYQLINVGSAAASSIEIGDRYDANSFETVHNANADGIVSMKFDELAPGAQMSFNVTVKPKLSGTYESTRARMKYSSGISIEGLEQDFKFGYSTSLGRTRILSTFEASRNSEYFFKQWMLFAALVGLLTVFPGYLWVTGK